MLNAITHFLLAVYPPRSPALKLVWQAHEKFRVQMRTTRKDGRGERKLFLYLSSLSRVFLASAHVTCSLALLPERLPAV